MHYLFGPCLPAIFIKDSKCLFHFFFLVTFTLLFLRHHLTELLKFYTSAAWCVHVTLSFIYLRTQSLRYFHLLTTLRKPPPFKTYLLLYILHVFKMSLFDETSQNLLSRQRTLPFEYDNIPQMITETQMVHYQCAVQIGINTKIF